MVNETDTTRPYAPPSNVAALLHRLRTRNVPERIDTEYLRDIGISDGTIHRVLFAIRFLGLVEEGGIPTQALRTINSATDEEYQATLAGLVRNAYADVFNVSDPAEDSQERILNIFRRYAPSSQRSRQVIFFLGMCREAGIPTLDTPRQRSMGEPRSAARRPARPRERASTNGQARQRTRGAGGLHPALDGLIGALPPEGQPFSKARRKQWLQMAEATLTFVYGEATNGGEGEAEEEEGRIE